MSFDSVESLAQTAQFRTGRWNVRELFAFARVLTEDAMIGERRTIELFTISTGSVSRTFASAVLQIEFALVQTEHSAAI